jgi:amidohydrolase
MPTAFVAKMQRGKGPVAAFLAEYDALPGYGTDHHALHACGHNWIAAAAVGSALKLAQMTDWQGTVLVIGTPAEETIGGKIELYRAGVFHDVDVCFEMHLHECNSLKPEALAIDPWEFVFTGKAAHASSSPYLGINALDAVNLTFAGISALRQQLKPDVRIHGIITEGGSAVNVIPDQAVCRFHVRSQTRSELDAVSERVKKLCQRSSPNDRCEAFHPAV